MSTVGDNIKSLREQRDWTQEHLAKLVGRTRSTITQWESGWSKPRMDMVGTLADIFGVTPGDIVGDKPITCSSLTDVPLYGAIAAGTPIEMVPVENSQPVPSEVRRRYPSAFLLKVEGDSMNKILPNGCYALVDPCDAVEHNGAPYAVCVNGYDATIKRVNKLNNGFELAPDSNDPTYSKQVFNYNEPGTQTITVIGEVVYFVLPFDWHF